MWYSTFYTASVCAVAIWSLQTFSFCCTITLCKKTVYALALEYPMAFYPTLLILITCASFMIGTLDQLFCYGSHFTSILLTWGGDGTPSINNQCFHNFSASPSSKSYLYPSLSFTPLDHQLEIRNLILMVLNRDAASMWAQFPTLQKCLATITSPCIEAVSREILCGIVEY